MRIKKAKQLATEEGDSEKQNNRQSTKLIDTSGPTVVEEETKGDSSQGKGQINESLAGDEQFEFVNSYQEDFVKTSVKKHQLEESKDEDQQSQGGRCNSFLNTLMMENATFEITDHTTGEVITLDEQ